MCIVKCVQYLYECVLSLQVLNNTAVVVYGCFRCDNSVRAIVVQEVHTPSLSISLVYSAQAYGL